MSPLAGRRLLLTGAVTAVVAWLVLDTLDARGTSVPVPWTAPALLVLLAAAVVAVGWPVRRWVRGHRDHPLDALHAARAVVLAQAAGTTGAVLVGFYAGLVLVLAPTTSIEARRDRLLLALAALVASLCLVGAGVVVERWCRLPPDDRDPPGRRGDGGLRSSDPSHSHASPPSQRGPGSQSRVAQSRVAQSREAHRRGAPAGSSSRP